MAVELNIRNKWRSYLSFFLLILINSVLLGFIVYYYYEKHEMDQWQKMRQKAVGLYNKGNLFSQHEKYQKQIEQIQNEIILDFSSAEMLAYISQLAQSNQLAQLNIEKLEQVNKNKQYAVKINALASFHDLWAFIKAIEVGKLPLRFATVTMREKGNQIVFQAIIEGTSTSNTFIQTKPMKTDDY